MKLSVLIPMYNEAELVADCAKRLSAALSACFDDGEWEIVFVDDGSTDGCRKILTDEGLPGVRAEGYEKNRGKGGSVRYGIPLCRGEHIVYTDCDLAYGTDAVVGIYGAIGENDIEIGSRALAEDGYSGYTKLRRLMSKVFVKIIGLFAGFRYSDSQCGLKCLRSGAARDIFSRCTVDGFAFDLEMLIVADRLGYKVGEYPAKIIHNRERGSKVNPVTDSLRVLRDVIRIKKRHRDLK